MICSLLGRQAKKQKAYCPEGGILCLSTRLIQQRNCRLYIAKLQNKFHVSAAEVDEQDTHQIIVIGVAAIVPHNAAADSLMEKISQFVEESTEAEIIDEERELR